MQKRVECHGKAPHGAARFCRYLGGKQISLTCNLNVLNSLDTPIDLNQTLMFAGERSFL